MSRNESPETPLRAADWGAPAALPLPARSERRTGPRSSTVRRQASAGTIRALTGAPWFTLLIRPALAVTA